ncbi:MAG: hypothetical protein GPJ54_14960 [Candidatus Heimdallarchaeota archaeon]|nr:hypothetical protein [Candidatus Heimdallarchaeota archaeon]
MALQHDTETDQQDVTQSHDFEFITSMLPLLEDLDLTVDDLKYFEELSPYLILDGHRTGVKDENASKAHGYIEGAKFSLKFAAVLKKLGGGKVTFLIHTLRNYKTMDRMDAIFDAILEVGKEFVTRAYEKNIRLKYYGHEVHDEYAMAKIINQAEKFTKNCYGFELNYLTNYSEQWGVDNQSELDPLPEINVIGRFTKGHYSGANIPGHTNAANFVYIQQASIAENWTTQEMIILALSLLKSHLVLKGYVGGKSYVGPEKEMIKNAREQDLWEDNYLVGTENPRKRIVSFSPMGPIDIKF